MPGIAIQLPALTLVEYSEKANESARFGKDDEGLQKVKFGYFGEIGGLLAAVKKASRDKLFEAETQFAGEEIGDALWYLITLARLGDVPANELGLACLKQLNAQCAGSAGTTAGAPTFRQIDGLVEALGGKGPHDQKDLLEELAETAGILTRDTRPQKGLSEHARESDRLGGLLALLAKAAASFDLKLEDIARYNLKKTQDRWPGENPTYHSFFDDDPKCLPYERFERVVEVKFEERKHGGKPHVVQSIHGVFVGDRLTDNSVEPDGYRFHDVFHLAYIAHLGWSPVIRGLLKRKRKSDPDVDENQDGARAMIIEEGIATWIFNHAKTRQFYEGVEPGKLEYGLLKQIRSMVDGYEVDQCPLWQWERAILDGFKVFRELSEAGGGWVHVDMNKHEITFKPLTEEKP